MSRSLSIGTATSASRPQAVPDFSRIFQSIIGQTERLDKIVPYLEMFHARLNPDDRPAGVFLLLGPTGVGKTRTVEAVAEALHGSRKTLLRVNCGEFSKDHEVAKLIGAPPGYLGHKETPAILSRAALQNLQSQSSNLGVILLDEVEKASTAFQRILLGILDSGSFQGGDNIPLVFENTVIFMTSNLGYAELGQMNQAPGFVGARNKAAIDALIQMRLKKHFAPEFLNRIDEQIYFEPLTREHLLEIVKLELMALQDHLDARLRMQTFLLDFPEKTLEWLVDRGTKEDCGARELKRVLFRYISHPLSQFILRGEALPGRKIRVEVKEDELSFVLKKP